MNRQEVYKEIEQLFGLVPSFSKMIPDSSLELEWRLFKQIQFDEGPIPNKYRELIGVAIASQRCIATGSGIDKGVFQAKCGFCFFV